MDSEFATEVMGRLEAMERSQSWLARQLNMKTPSTLHNYLKGKRPMPKHIRIAIAERLGIRLKVAA